MKNLKKRLLLIIVLIAWSVNSQSVIQKKDSVTVSLWVAKKIKLDLLDYDRLIENEVESNLKKCIVLQKEKDTVIHFLELQQSLYKETLLLTEKQLKIKNEQLKFNKKNKSKWFYGAGGLVVGTLIGIFVSK